jgi:predicted nucleic acid-binding protein
LLRWHIHRDAAQKFWEGLRSGAARIEPVRLADLEAAWEIGQAFPDQDFSLVDRTSFAVMLRLGIERVATLDDHFAIFRHGPGRRRAFTVIR